MRTIGAAILVITALAAAARADDVTIRVDDLLRASLPERDLRFFPWPNPNGSHSEEEEPAEPVVPLDSESLVKAVSFLSGGVEVRFVDEGVHIACAAETAELVKAAVARLRAQRPERVDLDFSLTAAGVGATSVVLSGRESIEPREWFTIADVGLRSALTDFDVEIAESSSIPDPIVRVTRSGSYVRLRVLPLPSSDEAVVEVDAVIVEPLSAEPMVPGWNGMAPLDRVRTSVDRTVLPLRIRSGEPAVCEWTGRDGRRVTLRVSGAWKPAPVDAGAAIVWSPLVNASIREFWFVPEAVVAANAEESEENPQFGKQREGVPFVAVDDVLAAQRTEVVADGGSGLVIFRGPAARSVRDGVVARLRESTRSAKVSLVAWDVPRGTEVPADGAAPAGGREMFRAAAPALLGRNSVFHAGEATTYLEDWDVEVAQASSIADPLIGVAITGSFANLTVRPGAAGTPAAGEADLDLTLAKSDGLSTQSVELLVPAGWAGGMASGKTSVPALMKTSYNVEKPKVRRSRIRTRLALSDTGVGVTRRSLPGLLGPERELVVVVRAE